MNYPKIEFDTHYRDITITVKKGLKIVFCYGYYSIEETTVHYNTELDCVIVIVHTSKTLGQLLNEIINQKHSFNDWLKFSFNHN